MVARHEQHQRAATVGDRVQPSVVVHARHQRHVDAVRAQVAQHAVRVAHVQRDVESRVAAGERGQQRDDVVRAVRAHAQPAVLQLARAAEQLLGLALDREQPRAERIQALAQRRQPHAAGTALEELDAVVLLQRLHLRGEGGLRHVQGARGVGEAARAGDGVEGTEVGDVHVTSPAGAARATRRARDGPFPRVVAPGCRHGDADLRAERSRSGSPLRRRRRPGRRRRRPRNAPRRGSGSPHPRRRRPPRSHRYVRHAR